MLARGKKEESEARMSNNIQDGARKRREEDGKKLFATSTSTKHKAE